MRQIDAFFRAHHHARPVRHRFGAGIRRRHLRLLRVCHVLCVSQAAAFSWMAVRVKGVFGKKNEAGSVSSEH